MAHQLTIWIPEEARIGKDSEAMFALYHHLGDEVANLHPEYNWAFHVEEVTDEGEDEDEPFEAMCPYCTEDHRGYYDSEEAYTGHIARVHPVEYRAEYGTTEPEPVYSEGEYLAEQINQGVIRP